MRFSKKYVFENGVDDVSRSTVKNSGILFSSPKMKKNKMLRQPKANTI